MAEAAALKRTVLGIDDLALATIFGFAFALLLAFAFALALPLAFALALALALASAAETWTSPCALPPLHMISWLPNCLERPQLLSAKPVRPHFLQVVLAASDPLHLRPCIGR